MSGTLGAEAGGDAITANFAAFALYRERHLGLCDRPRNRWAPDIGLQITGETGGRRRPCARDGSGVRSSSIISATEAPMQLDSSIAAVVTGGASGLGAATARLLAGHGVKVALFDLNVELGERVAAEIGGSFVRVDVTNEESVDSGFAAARAAHGQERILVNCAGTGNAYRTA